MRSLFCDCVVLSVLAVLLYLALCFVPLERVFPAPIPAAKNKPIIIPPMPVQEWELHGHWHVYCPVSGCLTWYVTLHPTGMYYCTSSREKRDNGLYDYIGNWSFKGGKLTIEEKGNCASPADPHREYSHEVKRTKVTGVFMCPNVASGGAAKWARH